MLNISQCLIFQINTKTIIFAMDHSCTALNISENDIFGEEQEMFLTYPGFRLAHKKR